MDTIYTEPWYHGSPERLTVLRKGSMVTRFKEMAKAFAHRPSTLSMTDSGAVKHNGQVPGYLYVVSETVGPDDVTCLEGTANTHWEIQRELQVTCVADLPIDDPPQLTEDEIAESRRDLPENFTGFISRES